MATTTNYGWTTPNDTDLVKDGASAIRTLGSAIDTTVFNNASAAIAKSIVDAKGDIIAATAADTVSRLAVGTNGQVLKADSTAATGLAWGSASSNFVGCLARKTSNQSITTNTATAVTFDAEDFDTDAFHSTSSNTSRFTVPAGKAGYYLFGTNLTDIGGGAVSGALALLSFYKNGTQITGSEVMWQKGTIDYIAWGANYVVNAAVNDYFEIFYLNTDEAANINGARTIAYFYYLGAA